MSLVLSHISALEYWRSMRRAPHCYTEALRAKTLIAATPKSGFRWPKELMKISKPFHVLVNNPALRRSTKSFTSHVWSRSLPKGYVCDVGGGLYVSSPEFCFMQMAEVMDVIELIELGFEFCGTYDVSGKNIESCAPLTNVARLAKFVKKAGAIRGSRKAAKALSNILDNSASPMETILAMLLCVPSYLGGYNLPSPLINYRVEMTEKGLLPGSYYMCDLFWPQARLAVEYDSDNFHAGKEKLFRDSIRRSDLASLGITVISVTRQQLINRLEMHQLAETFAKRLGRRIRYKEPDFTEAQNKLRQVLLGERRFPNKQPS